MYYGNKKIIDVNYGGTPIKKAYYGSQLVWQRLPTHGLHNGHTWIDLGLPSGLLWATMNVGANATYIYGDYFAWGETTTKSDYSASTSINYGVEVSDFSGQARFDVAAATWKMGWRMPTKEEFEELDRYCSVEIKNYSDINPDVLIGGRVGVVTGTNGNAIIFPLGGYKHNDSLYEDSYKGHYWSSTPSDSSSEGLFYAYDMNIQDDDSYGNSYIMYIPQSARYYGHNIRPVLDRTSLV